MSRSPILACAMGAEVFGKVGAMRVPLGTVRPGPALSVYVVSTRGLRSLRASGHVHMPLYNAEPVCCQLLQARLERECYIVGDSAPGRNAAGREARLPARARPAGEQGACALPTRCKCPGMWFGSWVPGCLAASIPPKTRGKGGLP